ncbi:MAG TPA: phosphate ABC transporter, permease protein PstA, partial [Acidobacteriota bacterium]|nr:phosphate ABC transporter, permease protein PstA [Acidobacteriota bacterium]
MFEATDLNLRQKKIEWLIKALLSLVTLFLIVPALTILAVLIYRGSPMISVEFLFGDPTNGMTAGGIFPALAGTIWLVAVSLLVAIPLGISAAI